MKSGYRREFEIPEKINNVDYNITVSGDELSLEYKGLSIISSIPNVTGNLTKGKNVIQNHDNVICLNVEPC